MGRRRVAVWGLGSALAVLGCSSESDGDARAAANQSPAGASGSPTPGPAGETPGTVSGDPAAPTKDDYASEKAWAESKGVVIEPNKVTVVAKRKGADRRSEAYDDIFVVFRPDGSLKRFLGSTKPAQMPNPSGALVPDVDDDGRKDLGIVRPGVYVAHGDVTYGMPGYERTAFKIKTEDGDNYLPAWRDLSGDGDYSPQEKSLSEQRDYRISGVYTHPGFADNGTKLGADEYIGPRSVGCFNIKYAELDDFVGTVGGASATFRFAIVPVP